MCSLSVCVKKNETCKIYRKWFHPLCRKLDQQLEGASAQLFLKFHLDHWPGAWGLLELEGMNGDDGGWC